MYKVSPDIKNIYQDVYLQLCRITKQCYMVLGNSESYLHIHHAYLINIYIRDCLTTWTSNFPNHHLLLYNTLNNQDTIPVLLRYVAVLRYSNMQVLNVFYCQFICIHVCQFVCYMFSFIWGPRGRLTCQTRGLLK